MRSFQDFHQLIAKSTNCLKIPDLDQIKFSKFRDYQNALDLVAKHLNDARSTNCAFIPWWLRLNYFNSEDESILNFATVGWAIAIENFQAKSTNEISLMAGNQVCLINKIDNYDNGTSAEWIFVRNNKGCGFVPSFCLKPIGNDSYASFVKSNQRDAFKIKGNLFSFKASRVFFYFIFIIIINQKFFCTKKKLKTSKSKQGNYARVHAVPDYIDSACKFIEQHCHNCTFPYRKSVNSERLADFEKSNVFHSGNFLATEISDENLSIICALIKSHYTKSKFCPLTIEMIEKLTVIALLSLNWFL